MRYGKREYEELGFDDTTASVLEVDRVQEIIRRRCERFNIRVDWDRNINTAVTSNEPPGTGYDYRIRIPAIESPCTKEDLIRTYMYVVHECGHLLRPEVFEISLRERPCEELQSIFNIIEDDSMEREVAGRNLGDARTLGEGNAILCKDGEIYWREAVQRAKDKGIEITEESLMPMIVMALQMLSRRDWDGWSRDALDSWLKCMPEEGAPLLYKLVDEGWVDKIRAADTPATTWEVSKDLFERLYPGGEVEPPPPPSGPGEGDEDEGDPEASDEGDAPTPSEDDLDDIFGEMEEEQVGKDKDKETPPEPEDGYVINWKDIGWSQHDDSKQAHGNGGPAGITFEGHTPKGGVAFAPHNEITVLPLYEKGYELPEVDRFWGSSRGRAAKHFEPCPNKGAALGNKVRRFVQSHTRARIRTDREEGMISNQDIARLLMPPVDGGNWNRRVFYDLQRKQAINTAIHILVDWSGSMGGQKAELAAQAAIRAGDVFDRQLKMPTMITAFTSYSDFCEVGIVKPFGMKVPTKDQAQSFATFTKWHGGNDDADAVMWSYRELMRRKEPRKILLVLSDGAPAGAYRGDWHSALLAATRHIQDEGKVELYGIGICSKAVSLYYDKYSIIDRANDINDALLNVLAQGVRYNG